MAGFPNVPTDALHKYLYPHLDSIERKRLKGTERRHGLVCAPTDTVFKTTRKNNGCPTYATNIEQGTGCCISTHVQDIEFLNALYFSYHMNQNMPSRTNALRTAAPDLYEWFERQNTVFQGRQIPANNFLNILSDRPWFEMILKFYLLFLPHFLLQIDGNPVTAVSNPHHVFAPYINNSTHLWHIPHNYQAEPRTTVLRLINEIGVECVEQKPHGASRVFNPIPVKCEFYLLQPTPMRMLNIEGMANVIQDPGSGFRKKLSYISRIPSGVHPGVSWEHSVKNMVLAMMDRFSNNSLEQCYINLRIGPSPQAPLQTLPWTEFQPGGQVIFPGNEYVSVINDATNSLNQNPSYNAHFTTREFPRDAYHVRMVILRNAQPLMHFHVYFSSYSMVLRMGNLHQTLDGWPHTFGICADE